jgi:hypothetical protein
MAHRRLPSSPPPPPMNSTGRAPTGCLVEPRKRTFMQRDREGSRAFPACSMPHKPGSGRGAGAGRLRSRDGVPPGVTPRGGPRSSKRHSSRPSTRFPADVAHEPLVPARGPLREPEPLARPGEGWQDAALSPLPVPALSGRKSQVNGLVWADHGPLAWLLTCSVNLRGSDTNDGTAYRSWNPWETR